MTELINQLVEEMKEIEPKYVAVRMDSRSGRIYKLFCGNNKEKLKNRLLEIVIKEMLLDEYLNVDKIKDCCLVDLHPNYLYLKKYNDNDDNDSIYIDFQKKPEHKYFNLNIFEDNLRLYAYLGEVLNYSIISELK